MLQLSARGGRRRQAGVTLIELMLGLAIMALLAAVGVPNMVHWLTANKARAAGEFYAEAVQMARRQAVLHNARSRLVLSENAANGQYDWQVDVCFPQPGEACTDQAGAWSTPDAPSALDPEGAAGHKSVRRLADALPPRSVVAASLLPVGADSVYFTETGWVDTVQARLAGIRLDPDADFRDEVPTVAVMITLSGMLSKCDPTRASGDSRACP